jgi:hypothetical protein
MRQLFFVVSLVAAACLATLAWRQNQHIAQLEQDAAGAMETIRTLQYRVETANKKRVQAETVLPNIGDEHAVTRTSGPSKSDASVIPAPTTASQSNGSSTKTNGLALLDEPGVQKRLSETIRKSLDKRYGAFFGQLNLPPTELEKLKDLLVERGMSSIDVVLVAQSKGMAPNTSGPKLAPLIEKARADVDESIRALLGEQSYKQYLAFNHAMENTPIPR